MSEVLFLSHRIPFPPDKGDKIRSYHLLRELASRHTVHLGTFIDDPRDWQHADAVRHLCGETCILPLNPRVARIRSAAGFATGEALTMRYYHDASLHRWVRQLAAARPLAGVFMFSSSMGQYGENLPLREGGARVMDFCDVDSDKWQQYSNSHGFPLRLVYAREARLLSQIEARFVSEFDATLVISDMEEKILRGVIGGASERLRVVPNGVDTGYFDPSLSFASPFSGGALPIVFTGAMDYHANVDGVRWFATAILPAIQRRNPAAVFVVVGSNPSAEVRALAARPGIVVTGRVADVRPYLGHAAVVVAPLRIARGVQNKVLEALAMARPVVATENAVQGIPGIAQASAAVTSDPVRFADAVAERLSGPSECSPSRAFVMDNFDWTRHLAGVASIFEARLDKLPRSASGTSTLD